MKHVDLDRVVPRWWAPAVVALSCLYLVWGYWRPSLWMDEVASVMGSNRSLDSLLELTKTVDAVHGTYYALLGPVVKAFGQSEAVLRAPSVLAGTMSCILVFLAGREFVSSRAGAFAAVVFAFSPVALWMSSEARGYGIAAMLSAGALWCAVRAMGDGRHRWWIASGVLTAAAGWMFLYSILAGVVIGVVALVWFRRPVSSWLSQLAAGATVVPLLLRASSQSKQISWIKPTDPLDLAQMGFWTHPLDDPWLAWLEAGLAAAILVGFVLARVLGRIGWRRPDTQVPATVLLLGAVLAPLVVLSVAGAFAPVYLPRYLTFVVPAMAVLAGLAIDAAPRLVAGIALAAALVLGGLSSGQVRAVDAKDTMRLAAQRVEELSEPGDGLLMLPRGDGFRSSRYLADGYPQQVAGTKDLTLVQPYWTRPVLWTREAGLEKFPDRLASVDRVIVVGFHMASNPKYWKTHSSETLLRGAGFAPEGTDQFQGWSVTVWKR